MYSEITFKICDIMKINKRKSFFMLVFLLIIFTNYGQAATSDKNNIISDGEFRNYQSMTQSQIQDFLTSENSFLATYKTVDNDGVEKLPSEMIINAANKYQINPKVIITMLQKEQSIITTAPGEQTTLQLDKAMGYESPDYYGFAKQIDRGTWQLDHNIDKIDSDGTTINGWTVGVSKETEDNVIITPENKATASLYSYNPLAGAGWGGGNWGANYLFWDLYFNIFEFSSETTDKTNTISSGYSRIEKAIAWSESKIGTGGYEIRCLSFVLNAYRDGANTNIKRYDDAKTAAIALEASKNSGNPPRGTFVFYEWTDPTCPDCGHVGLSLGDGNIIHAYGYNPIKKSQYTEISLTYIGWAYPPVTPPLIAKSAWEFNSPKDLEGWIAFNAGNVNENVNVQDDGRFIIDPLGPDPWIENNGIYLDASNLKNIEFGMSSNLEDNIGAVYFSTSESPGFSEDKKVTFNVITSPEWHDYKVLMAGNAFWNGIITGIRIDPGDFGNPTPEDNGDTFGFDYIHIVPSNIIKAQAIYPYPNTIKPGDELEFIYNIENQFSNKIPIKIRLGAQIRLHDPMSPWIDDMPNDGIEALKPGTVDYKRIFSNTNDLKSGTYDVHWVVMDEGTKQWFDHKQLDQILIVNSNNEPNPTSKPTETTINPTESPTIPSPQDDKTEVTSFIKTVTLTLENTINKLIDLIKGLF